MKIEKKFKNLIKEARKTILFKEEKEGINLNLVKFIKENPVVRNPILERPLYNPETKSSFKIIMNYLFEKRMRAFAFLAIAILLFGGAGISFAAQGSLPGDPLYPVKVGFNEKVLRMVLFSDEAKAKYDIQLVQLRLQEAEKVAVDKGLNSAKTAELKNLLDQHIADAKSHLGNIKNSNAADIIANIDSELESSLAAHSQILGKIADVQKGQDKTAAFVKNILSDVQEKTDKARIDIKNNYSKLSGQSSADILSSAEGKLKSAGNKIKEVANFIENKKSNVSESAYNAAKNNLKIANDEISDGQVLLDAKSYNDAFDQFQAAEQTAQKTKIYVQQGANLKIELNIPEIQIKKDADSENSDSSNINQQDNTDQNRINRINKNISNQVEINPQIKNIIN
jgi:hypothetical protein